MEFLPIIQDSGTHIGGVQAGFPGEFLSNLTLQGCEPKAGFFVSLDDELNQSVAKVADPVKQQDRMVFGYLDFIMQFGFHR
jgi:hypothetical protein